MIKWAKIGELYRHLTELCGKGGKQMRRSEGSALKSELIKETDEPPYLLASKINVLHNLRQRLLLFLNVHPIFWVIWIISSFVRLTSKSYCLFSSLLPIADVALLAAQSLLCFSHKRLSSSSYSRRREHATLKSFSVCSRSSSKHIMSCSI